MYIHRIYTFTYNTNCYIAAFCLHKINKMLQSLSAFDLFGGLRHWVSLCSVVLRSVVSAVSAITHTHTQILSCRSFGTLCAPPALHRLDCPSHVTNDDHQEIYKCACCCLCNVWQLMHIRFCASKTWLLSR